MNQEINLLFKLNTNTYDKFFDIEELREIINNSLILFHLLLEIKDKF